MGAALCCKSDGATPDTEGGTMPTEKLLGCDKSGTTNGEQNCNDDGSKGMSTDGVTHTNPDQSDQETKQNSSTSGSPPGHVKTSSSGQPAMPVLQHMETKMFTGKKQSSIRHIGYYKIGRSDEDRNLRISNLGKYVLTFNVSPNLSEAINSKDPEIVRKLEQAMNSQHPQIKKEFLPEYMDTAIKNAQTGIADGMSLFAVFDGHMGQIAANYMAATLPFALLRTESFLRGDWEKSLADCIQKLHFELIEGNHLILEKPEHSNSAAGTTVAVALSTSTHTYFANLGDSPIFYASSHHDGSMGPIFQVLESHTWENEIDRQRLMDSNYPLLIWLENEVTQNEEMKAVQFTNKELRDRMDDFEMRAGFSGVEPAGTVGDTCYDPSLFNSLLDALDDFKREKLLEESKLILEATYENLELANMTETEIIHQVVNDQWQQLYPCLLKYVNECDGYRRYCKQFQLDPCIDGDCDGDWQQKDFLQHYFTLSNDQVSQQRLPETPFVVRRKPSTKTVLNSDMLFYFMSSDGVLSREERYQSHWNRIKSIVSRYQQRGSNEYFGLIQAYFYNNPDDREDDQTCIIAWPVSSLPNSPSNNQNQDEEGEVHQPPIPMKITVTTAS